MADGNTPPADAKPSTSPKGGKAGSGSGLKRKVGPLPIWAWAVGAGVLIGGFMLYVRGRGGGGESTGTPMARDGIQESEYGTGAGLWDPGLVGGGSAEQPTPEIIEVPGPPQIEYVPTYIQDSVDMPSVSTTAGGVSRVKAPSTNSKKVTLANQRLTKIQKERGFTNINRNPSSARAGQAYKVTTRADGSKVHTYQNGKKVVVAAPKKSTATVNKQTAKPAPVKKVAQSGPNKGKTYTVTNRADGSKVHTYADGHKVVVKPPAKKKK